jgi:hypothetical protein
MSTILWLVTGLACAQIGPPTQADGADAAREFSIDSENTTAPRPAQSKIVAVTVYQGHALVTREVTVPEGDGTVELVVTPLPAQTIDSSLYTEGTQGLRVLSTRFRTRAVKEDTRRDVRAREEQLKKLETEAFKLQQEVAVQDQDLQYIKQLEGFTGTALKSLTERGRLESKPILDLSKFVFENRSAKTRAQTDLRQQLLANTEAAQFARRQLDELSIGSSRIERDAVIVVQRVRHEAGIVRLGYLVGAANWWPEYRLRGAPDNARVRLEYLADVVQHTGENWSGVRITLTNARPSLEAAPPELLPLKMAVPQAADMGPIDAVDDTVQRTVAPVADTSQSDAEDYRSRKILAELEKPISMTFANDTPLGDVLKYIKQATTAAGFAGIPIHVDPIGLQEAEKTEQSTVKLDLEGVPLKTTLRLLLEQLGLAYKVKGGVLIITSLESQERTDEEESRLRDLFNRAKAAIAGMGPPPDEMRPSGGATLNMQAANNQADELRVTPTTGSGSPAGEKDSPSVTFAIMGSLDVPSRRDPQLLEIGRVELPAEYYAKAVPVLTPRVYRLAKVTNASDFVLLPGEATVYVGSDFVGRMRLPLVAAGEPFNAGFGADPQLQVSRRLVSKSRSLQGGNQIFTYDFRLGLRNYRTNPVKFQLWDRLPRAQGEAIAVNLIKTSAPLSTDPMYQRNLLTDNLLRWDFELPQGTIGEKTKYLSYEFRLEYARNLPQPRFVAGDLREGPIGGGAMGMGGMGGMGMR